MRIAVLHLQLSALYFIYPPFCTSYEKPSLSAAQPNSEYDTTQLFTFILEHEMHRDVKLHIEHHVSIDRICDLIVSDVRFSCDGGFRAN